MFDVCTTTGGFFMTMIPCMWLGIKTAASITTLVKHSGKESQTCWLIRPSTRVSHFMIYSQKRLLYPFQEESEEYGPPTTEFIRRDNSEAQAVPMDPGNH